MGYLLAADNWARFVLDASPYGNLSGQSACRRVLTGVFDARVLGRRGSLGRPAEPERVVQALFLARTGIRKPY